MARILAISSQVARGHVGLSAVVPALQSLGHEVWPLPTILLSNHPGHAHVTAVRTDPEVLRRMVAALEANGWLDQVDAVLSGYLPSAAHVAFVAETVRRLKERRPVLYLCDPVLGDEPKGVYLDAAAAGAIRSLLLPLADVATPNRFELGWLTDLTPSTAGEAIAAAQSLSPPVVYVTSAARRGDDLLNVCVEPGEAAMCAVRHHEAAPRGTGDLFAGLVLGHSLASEAPPLAMARAAQGVAVALDRSRGRDELQLTTCLREIAAAPAIGLETS